MPRNISGEYIWLVTHTPQAYSVLEGQIETTLPLSAIVANLKNEFIPFLSRDSEQHIFGLDKHPNSPYNMLVIRDDFRFCIIWLGQHIIKEPVSDIFDFLSTHVEDVLNAMSKSFSNNDEIPKIKLLKMYHQVSSCEM